MARALLVPCLTVTAFALGRIVTCGAYGFYPGDPRQRRQRDAHRVPGGITKEKEAGDNVTFKRLSYLVMTIYVLTNTSNSVQ